MFRTNEIRHIKWHETCKCECTLDAVVCNTEQHWNKDKCRCKCKKLTDKGACNKGYTWNPSNSDFECNKSFDIDEYLDCDKCKCRKRLIDKLVDECDENIDEEIKILDENEDKCNSCIFYIVLF